MHTQSSSEYWHRSGSLVHTDPLGKQRRGDSRRRAHLRLRRHAARPGQRPARGQGGSGQLPSNPADYRPLLRALLVALDDWVKDGAEPPPSVYPEHRRRHAGRLAEERKRLAGDSRRELSRRSFSSRDVARPRSRLDRPSGSPRSSRRKSKGHYVVKVPACGPDGNERGTLNSAGDHRAGGDVHELEPARRIDRGRRASYWACKGATFPSPRTPRRAREAGDPRPPL